MADGSISKTKGLYYKHFWLKSLVQFRIVLFCAVSFRKLKRREKNHF